MVYAEVENDNELMYSYQLVDTDLGYGVWVSTGPLKGKFVGRDIEDFEEAFNLFVNTVREQEFA